MSHSKRAQIGVTVAIVAVIGGVPLGSQTNGSSAPPLVHAADMTQLGVFYVPKGLHSGGTANAGFEYGGTALSYDSSRNGLFMVGHDWDQFVGEISVPSLGGTAKLLQPLLDATEGIKNNINPGSPNSKKIGGTLAWGTQLLISVYDYYDGTSTQVVSHVVRPLDLSVTGQVHGPYRLGPLNAGFYSGYMAVVPAALRPLLGGPAITGQADLAVVGRTSLGPGAFSFDPATIGTIPAQPLVYYPEVHPTLGIWAGASQYYGGSDSLTGVVALDNTSSVLFFGRHGTTFCYGPGTSDTTLVGQSADGGVDTWCYDPVNSSKGTHGYPYVSQVQAYSASDLAAVRAGSKQPWDIKPYETWPLAELHGKAIGGVAYDPSTGRLFVSEMLGDDVNPLIHVYTVKSGAVVAAPVNVRIVR